MPILIGRWGLKIQERDNEENKQEKYILLVLYSMQRKGVEHV